MRTNRAFYDFIPSINVASCRFENVDIGIKIHIKDS